MTYIAFLRGINVGGHNVKMERLRELFAELGLKNVRTYINSGNVFFDADMDRQKLTQSIEKHLAAGLGYEVPVFLRTISELEHTLALDAFKGIDLTPDKRFCVVFTADSLPKDLDLPIDSSKEDMQIVHLTDREAFIVWRIINGRPPAGRFPVSILPAKNTSRFYHTLAKILEAARKV